MFLPEHTPQTRRRGRPGEPGCMVGKMIHIKKTAKKVSPMAHFF